MARDSTISSGPPALPPRGRRASLSPGPTRREAGRPPLIRDRPTFEMLSLSVTHELRQSLSLIRGYAELLATRELGEADRAAAVAAIRAAAARLGGSLDRLERTDGTRRLRFGPHGERELFDLRA